MAKTNHPGQVSQLISPSIPYYNGGLEPYVCGYLHANTTRMKPQAMKTMFSKPFTSLLIPDSRLTLTLDSFLMTFYLNKGDHVYPLE